MKPLLKAGNTGLRRAMAAGDLPVTHGITRDRMRMTTFGTVLARADVNEPVGQERDCRVEVRLIRE